MLTSTCGDRNFNPRPPCGGRRTEKGRNGARVQFQSTPPVRGATAKACAGILRRAISIHAPRAGGDLIARSIAEQFMISIHAPRAGGDI